MILGGTRRYRAEALGKVPYGLTHNDVFATVNSVLRENVKVQSVTKRRLAGDMVSIVAVFEANGEGHAVTVFKYATSSVFGWSHDNMIKELP